MILKAHAKINLHLDVGSRRNNGYHSLKTVFQELGLHDTLVFSLSDGPIQLSVSPRMKSLTGSNNLVVRALKSLKKSLGVRQGVRVQLTKRIPIGAGLGGGSSDAAAALWGGWLLWKAKPRGQRKWVRPKRTPALLHRCARRVGADVPFFLRGGKAFAEGIGDKLTPLKKSPKQWIVLVYPRVHVSTAEAYGLLDEQRKRNTTNKVKRSKVFNSFESVILKEYPAIAAAKRALISSGATGVMMSGSGSTLFGFVTTKRAGHAVLRRLKRFPWDCFLTHTL